MNIELEKKIRIDLTLEEAYDLRFAINKCFENLSEDEKIVPLLELNNKIILCLNND